MLEPLFLPKFGNFRKLLHFCYWGWMGFELMQCLMGMNAGIDFLEFRPSEIAAAVAISVSVEMQTLAIDKAISSFIFVEKVKRKRKSWCPQKQKLKRGQICFCC